MIIDPRSPLARYVTGRPMVGRNLKRLGIAEEKLIVWNGKMLALLVTVVDVMRGIVTRETVERATVTRVCGYSSQGSRCGP